LLVDQEGPGRRAIPADRVLVATGRRASTMWM
jgi:pyruvate/2-oxoglutarate dehydrogenase complex dihydrolipoamide dehydrogenase (E3) component